MRYCQITAQFRLYFPVKALPKPPNDGKLRSIVIPRSFDCMPTVPRGYPLSKIMLRAAYCLLLSFNTIQGFQPQDLGLEKDVYAIYSLMLTNPRTSHGADKNERYLIATTTTPGSPEEPCIRPPKERAADFREVLADYKRRKSIPRELKPTFSVGKPYELLSDEEARDFVAERRLGIPGSNRRFLGVTDLSTLSDVYFDQRRTLALTAISSWCGSLCALYQWKVFQKMESGKWEEQLDWVGCLTIARN